MSEEKEFWEKKLMEFEKTIIYKIDSLEKVLRDIMKKCKYCYDFEKLDSPKEQTVKPKMTDDEVMRFNEELMGKIHKRKVQPLDKMEKKEIEKEIGINIDVIKALLPEAITKEKTEPEKVREPALNCFDCSEQIKHESEIEELIEEFIKDLTSNHPMIGFKYTREDLINKWQGRVK